MDKYSLYIGLGAGVFTAISLLPQLFKIIKEKQAENISITMLLILLIGLCGWIVYGVLKDDYPLIITNSFSLIVNILIIIFSSFYKQKNK